MSQDEQDISDSERQGAEEGERWLASRTPEQLAFLRSYKMTHRLKSGFVYLCRNNRNGYTKIGFTKNPSHRERTLQSEEPEVEIIYTTRRSMWFERALHNWFASKRIRGEWFNLQTADVEFIKSI